jgi:hypothetical protein
MGLVEGHRKQQCAIVGTMVHRLIESLCIGRKTSRGKALSLLPVDQFLDTGQPVTGISIVMGWIPNIDSVVYFKRKGFLPIGAHLQVGLRQIPGLIVVEGGIWQKGIDGFVGKTIQIGIGTIQILDSTEDFSIDKGNNFV